MLFATLDPTTRKVKLPGFKTHPEVLLTDTVGFIQKLPTNLVAAFRATLEEVEEADVLIHIIDRLRTLNAILMFPPITRILPRSNMFIPCFFPFFT